MISGKTGYSTGENVGHEKWACRMETGKWMGWGLKLRGLGFMLTLTNIYTAAHQPNSLALKHISIILQQQHDSEGCIYHHLDLCS